MTCPCGDTHSPHMESAVARIVEWDNLLAVWCQGGDWPGDPIHASSDTERDEATSLYRWRVGATSVSSWGDLFAAPFPSYSGLSRTAEAAADDALTCALNYMASKRPKTYKMILPPRLREPDPAPSPSL